MRRGEVRWVDLDPARGSEASKRRPAVVVSNDAANAAALAHGRGVVTVVPVTSNVSAVLPFQVLLPRRASGLGRDSKAQAEQLRAISVDRIGELVRLLPPRLVVELDDALRLHLGL
jgi:mRNA interferase MazF